MSDSARTWASPPVATFATSPLNVFNRMARSIGKTRPLGRLPVGAMRLPMSVGRSLRLPASRHQPRLKLRAACRECQARLLRRVSGLNVAAPERSGGSEAASAVTGGLGGQLLRGQPVAHGVGVEAVPPLIGRLRLWIHEEGERIAG